MDKPEDEDDMDYSVSGKEQETGKEQEDCVPDKDAAHKGGWKRRTRRVIFWSAVAVAGGLGAMYANDHYKITGRISDKFGSATHTIETTIDKTKHTIKDALTTSPDEARDKLIEIIKKHPETNLLEVVGPLYNLVPEDVRVHNAVDLLKSAEPEKKPGYVSQITAGESLEIVMQSREYLNNELGKYKTNAIMQDAEGLGPESRNSIETRLWELSGPKYQFNTILQRSKELEPEKKAALITEDYGTLDKKTSQDVFYRCDEISDKKFDDRGERTYNLLKKDMKDRVDKLKKLFEDGVKKGQDTYEKGSEMMHKAVEMMD